MSATPSLGRADLAHKRDWPAIGVSALVASVLVMLGSTAIWATVVIGEALL